MTKPQPRRQPHEQPPDRAAPVLHDTLALTIAGGAALQMLMKLLPEASKNVEHASQDLTVRFKTLAENSATQGDMVQALLATIGTLEINGKRVPLDEFIALFSKTLDDAINKLLFISKKALTMVYSMDDAIKNLHEIEKFSKKIQELTKQSNLLALNATIEAQRAGEWARPSASSPARSRRCRGKSPPCRTTCARAPASS